MNTPNDHDLERLLQLRAAPRPPADLGERIKAAIPQLEAFDLAAAGRVRDRVPIPNYWTVARWLPIASSATMLASVVAAIVVFDSIAQPHPRHSPLARLGGDSVVEVVRPAEPSAAEAAAMRQVTIEVAVLGPDEEPRAGAPVLVERLGSERRALAVVTDRHGRVQVAGLPPGTYRVRCTPALEVAAGDEVTLDAGQAASLLLQLEPLS